MTVTFVIKAELRGAHVHARIWAGAGPGQRGLTGTLSMRPEEWGAFAECFHDRDNVEIETPWKLTERELLVIRWEGGEDEWHDLHGGQYWVEREDAIKKAADIAEWADVREDCT